ncbi:hypothetical protein RHGRI_010841 [Rhododendron griersonianum]|uniref:DUF4283 domain-containing protein n=1 Tax=Rhododendron griersonianum TaxID=479676 RepID=A0AAV6KL42_9ERIC|nr:hypothetical protein RHGRI_010841 [Rhododendron griersonianum]
MGGNFVLLTFDSVEDMSLMLEESGMCWLRNWFVDVIKKWNPDFKIDSKKEEICLVLNGNSYLVRVVLEEHVVVNNIMKANFVCKDNMDSNPRSEDESEGDSEKDKVDEAKEVKDDFREIPSSSNAVEIEIRFLANEKHIVVKDVEAHTRKVDGLVSSSNSECHSITSPISLSRPKVTDRSVGLSIPGEKSIHEAIQKLDRRLKRSRRKSSKMKSLFDFGLKVVKVKKNNKVVPLSSLSSSDIR